MKTHPPPPFPMNLQPCVSMVRIDLNRLQRSQNNLHLHGKCGKRSNKNSRWTVSSESMCSSFSTIFPMSISLIYIHRTTGTNLIQTSPNVLLHSKYLTPCKMTLTKIITGFTYPRGSGSWCNQTQQRGRSRIIWGS